MSDQTTDLLLNQGILIVKALLNGAWEKQGEMVSNMMRGVAEGWCSDVQASLERNDDVE